MGENTFAYRPGISSDGRFAVFWSDASNLVAGDTNNAGDLFVRDRLPGLTERVSVDSSGGQLSSPGVNDHVISGDGRFVAFQSFSSSIVPNDTNNDGDIFVHDRLTDTTERVSVDSAGGQASGGSSMPDISADGRFVAFMSYASNLVANDTNDCSPVYVSCPDIFVHDRQTGVTERVNVDSAGNQATDGAYSDWPTIGADGRFVAFSSGASNLVPGDNNGSDDVFVHDRLTGVTERVSLDSAGNEGNGLSGQGVISADGMTVAFLSIASNLTPDDLDNCPESYPVCPDIFVHDRQSGTTERVSVESEGREVNPIVYLESLSADGRFVLFYSEEPDIVPGDTNNLMDIFVYDRLTNVTARVNVNDSAEQANGWSAHANVSDDGRVVVFRSFASNLVAGDTNDWADVFVRDLGDFDEDGEWDPFDPDDDSDALHDTTETACGSDPLSAASIPERSDTPGDDDGDTFVNEALPAGADAYDCDGDGYKGTAEANVATSDQDPCGNNGWPSDLVPGGLQPNTLNIQDLGSFIVPVRRIGTSVGDPGFDARWDLVPGSAIGPHIAVTDIAATVVGASGYPPMFGGLRAYGKTCPWAP